MAQANTDTSTTSRRRFLAIAGLASAASATALAAAAMPVHQACTADDSALLQSAAARNDPIFAAIEAHKAAFADVVTAIDVHCVLESELPREKMRSHVTRWEEKIVETDDPRWIESERAVIRAWEAEEDTAIALVCIQPTTKAGFFALIEHAIAHDGDGEGWPRDLESDDGARTRCWHQFLLESLVAAKGAVMGRAAA
jgi:hypothetical protein